MKQQLLLGAAALTLASSAQAATIVIGDVTNGLTSTAFIDEASTGGGDQTINDSSGLTGLSSKSYAGISGSGVITITGFGFATSGNTTANNATSIDLTFTYLGLDGVTGGGDDVTIGSVDNIVYSHSAAGEYFVNFDTAISASIDGANDVFQVSVNVNDLNGGLVESIRFKTDAGAKQSVNGSFVAVPEPSSSALLGLGGLTLLLRRRR